MTPYDLMARMTGIREIEGETDHPLIQFGFSLCRGWGMETADEVPWCSSFLQIPFWLLRQPRSYSARARSWLLVGEPVHLADARVGHDVVILKRGLGEQPGPENTTAKGHVGLYAGRTAETVEVLGANQGDAVCLRSFWLRSVLGVRRCRAAGGNNG